MFVRGPSLRKRAWWFNDARWTRRPPKQPQNSTAPRRFTRSGAWSRPSVSRALALGGRARCAVVHVVLPRRHDRRACRHSITPGDQVGGRGAENAGLERFGDRGVELKIGNAELFGKVGRIAQHLAEDLPDANGFLAKLGEP